MWFLDINCLYLRSGGVGLTSGRDINCETWGSATRKTSAKLGKVRYKLPLYIRYSVGLASNVWSEISLLGQLLTFLKVNYT